MYVISVCPILHTCFVFVSFMFVVSANWRIKKDEILPAHETKAIEL